MFTLNLLENVSPAETHRGNSPPLLRICTICTICTTDTHLPTAASDCLPTSGGQKLPNLR
ncbi:hypothetical protein SOVF_029370 [Spinacia oleracea]|nr:hypothetical protein SOVF_029370 [Spinacia oleracea]